MAVLNHKSCGHATLTVAQVGTTKRRGTRYAHVYFHKSSSDCHITTNYQKIITATVMI